MEGRGEGRKGKGELPPLYLTSGYVPGAEFTKYLTIYRKNIVSLS